MPDAIVIGAGPNGLVAANRLADAGWSVQVVEAEPVPGGAVKSSELIEPGFVNDHFSAFYPLAVASPAIRELQLEQHGLRWRHGPLVLAHPAPDGSCPVLSRDLAETAASLGEDGDAWRRLYELWQRVGPAGLQLLVTPVPPVVPGLRALLAAREYGPIRLARLATLSVRRFNEEHFATEEAGRLLAGSALHTDVTPDSALGGFFGFVLCALGQQFGWPVPEGGAGELSGALVRRLEARGGTIECGAPVERILVRGGRAVGVRTAGGESIEARRAVLAAVDAPQLYLRLLDSGDVPARVLADMHRFDWDWATVKLDWTLDGPIPWTAEPARRSPVVHISDSVELLTRQSTELELGRVPERPFLVFGQYSMADPTRSPAGKETAWAYTHVPQGTDEAAIPRVVEAMEAEVERLAPGFRDLVRGRHVFSPQQLEAANRNLHGGAINGGTAKLHQQLVFRPRPGLGRPGTPIRGLYLASSSAHPGGGVHGGAGAIAARVALRAHRLRR
jgi:phytoene dehydrogenase-like protein